MRADALMPVINRTIGMNSAACALTPALMDARMIPPQRPQE
jgi:hypothetical protein